MRLAREQPEPSVTSLSGVQSADRSTRRQFGSHPGQRRADAHPLVRGLLNVLLVVASLRRLHAGDSGVGFLNSAFGAGALVGGLAGISLLRRTRLGDPFALALVLWGAPIALVVAWPTLGWALLCMAGVGAGNSVLDISGYTLLQRSVADAVLGRVFAALEIIGSGAIGVGSIAAPALSNGLGVRGALIATGAFLPLLALLLRARLRALDDATTVPHVELDFLASVRIFEPLAPTTLEKLAVRLRPLSMSAGNEIVTEGETGNSFYLIRSGEVDVIHDDRLATTLSAGDFFGEIDLLHDVPRGATCVARTDADLYELDRQVFVSAVTGQELSHATIVGVVEERLERAGRTSRTTTERRYSQL